MDVCSEYESFSHFESDVDDLADYLLDISLSSNSIYDTDSEASNTGDDTVDSDSYENDGMKKSIF